MYAYEKFFLKYEVKYSMQYEYIKYLSNTRILHKNLVTQHTAHVVGHTTHAVQIVS